MLVNVTAGQKLEAKKQEPLQSQQLVRKLHAKKPSQLQQPNLLDKYEFKKLTHFERLQQEKLRRIQNLDPEHVQAETEVQSEIRYDFHDNVEEVNLL